MGNNLLDIASNFSIYIFGANTFSIKTFSKEYRYAECRYAGECSISYCFF